MDSENSERRDWLAWHESYRDASSPHSTRLRIVQEEIRRVLPERPDKTFTIVSLCAGQGDDLIGALEGYPHADRIRARLVELDERNFAMLRERAHAAGLDHFEMVRADAADTDQYEGIVPADLVLLCGVFGNISNADIRHTISCMPQFCGRGSRVVWTRHRREPDMTPTVRKWFEEYGFAETGFFAPEGLLISVGSCRFEGRPQPLKSAKLFTFIV
jgi:hypothetical protein